MGVGPSGKETTKHYYKDPILEIVTEDTDVNLRGVVIAGCPDSNDDKMRTAQRVGTLMEAMNVDGAIFTCVGYGNNSVDFAQAVAETESRGIPVAALSMVSAKEMVVHNNYLDDSILCFYKPRDGEENGTETNMLAENTVDHTDARKALAFLKLKMRK